MRSGTGPADTLKTVDIAMLNEQNQLGRNLQNHLFLHLGAVIGQQGGSRRRHAPARSAPRSSPPATKAPERATSS